MRHRKHTFKIGRSGAHRKALLANQVCSLIRNGSIKTTLAKAKETRRVAEKMVTLGKNGTLHHRRIAIAKLRDVDAVGLLFSEIAPKHANRDGGYTRIIKLGQRRGDAAELCVLQWIEEEVKKKSPKKKSSKKSEASKDEAEKKEKNTKAEAEKEETPKAEAKPEAEKEEAKTETEATEEKSEPDEVEKEEEKEEKKD
jgi:large subunit ribosomal protein L17